MRQWTAQEVTKVLRKRGAECVAQKGSHAKYRYGACVATVAVHRGDIPKGTLAAIVKAFEPEFGKGWLK